MFENYSDVERKAWLVIAGTYFETMQSVDELKDTIKKNNPVKVLMQNSNRTGHRDLLAVPVYLGKTDIFDMENAEVLVDGEAFDKRQAEEYEKQRAEAEAQKESVEETIEETAEEDLSTDE